MDIKVLGTGCPKCKNLEQRTHEAVKIAGVTASVSKVEDILEIMKYGIMATPALVIDGKVAVKGRLPALDEIVALIKAQA